MKPKTTSAFLVAGLVLVSITSLRAQTWNAATGDFRDPANWTPAQVPGFGEIGSINNGGTATFGAGPELDVGALLAGGDGSGASNLSGNLTVTGGVMLLSSSRDSISAFGNVAQDPATVPFSTLKMDGGEIQVDDPFGVVSGKTGLSKGFDYNGTGTNTWTTSGFYNKDLLFGSRSRGRLELHNGARLLAGDDLSFANNGTSTSQTAELLMDGSSLIAIGSGSEIGKTNATVTMTLAGSSRFVAGNSAGPGVAAGQTDEGYITIGTRDTGTQTVDIKGQAEMQCMTLQNRFGTTNISLTETGKLKIYNVFAGSGTILATRPSYIASGSPASTTISLRGSSTMLVDCLLGNAASGGSNMVNGLHVSGGENLQSGVAGNPGTYNSTAGGTAVLDVGESATLDIKQGLHLGFGSSASANATLRVTGPSANVSIGGNFNMAFNEYLETLTPGTGVRPGTAILEYVITGPTQAPVNVTGAARIGNGILYLTLNGYTPPRGTRYTLINAGSVSGSFKYMDFTLAPLSGKDVWKVVTTGTTVTATVSEPYLTISTDATDATLVWPGPATLQYSPDLVTPFVDVPGASSPYITPLDAAKKFYRLHY